MNIAIQQEARERTVEYILSTHAPFFSFRLKLNAGGLDGLSSVSRPAAHHDPDGHVIFDLGDNIMPKPTSRDNTGRLCRES